MSPPGGQSGGGPTPPGQPRKWVQPKVVGGMVVRPAPGERGHEPRVAAAPLENEPEPRRGFWAWLPRAGGLLGDDPGSAGWERGALGAILVLLPLVIFFQQFTLGLRNQTLSTAPASIRNSEAIDDPGVAALTINTKLVVKLTRLVDSLERHAGEGEPGEESDFTEAVEYLDTIAVTRTERVRMAMVAGELSGKADALARLDALAAEAEKGGGLALDIDWLRQIYLKGRESVPEEVRASLVLRHGWFGQLATTFGALNSDSSRWSAVAGGAKIIGFFVAYGGVMALVGLGGLIALIAVLVKRGQGSLEFRFEPPGKGGSVYLETYVVFLAGFMVLLAADLVGFGLGVEASAGSIALNEVLLWSLVLTALWPIARGVEWKRALSDMGWHRGQGVMKEIICGVVGFLAGRMLFWVGDKIGQVIDALSGVLAEEAPGGYPMFDAPSASWGLLILGALSSVLWAPVVEETIMRGALYRHVRSRWRVLWSSLLTAALFGAVHPYSTSGIVSVAFGGLAFALMREWRGCLIAPVIAHALHNGSIEFLEIGTVSVVS